MQSMAPHSAAQEASLSVTVLTISIVSSLQSHCLLWLVRVHHHSHCLLWLVRASIIFFLKPLDSLTSRLWPCLSPSLDTWHHLITYICVQIFLNFLGAGFRAYHVLGNAHRQGYGTKPTTFCLVSFTTTTRHTFIQCLWVSIIRCTAWPGVWNHASPLPIHCLTVSLVWWKSMESLHMDNYVILALRSHTESDVRQVLLSLYLMHFPLNSRCWCLLICTEVAIVYG